MFKLKDIRKKFVLSKTKYFSFKEIRWFAFSILVISTLFTVSSSFLLGFSQTDIFTSDASDDILIITEPKITPTQSRIPLYWVQDIQEIDGILAVSPETIDVVIDHSNGETPFFRGVTSNYKSMQSNFDILEGRWFNFELENTSLNKEIIIGSKYANLLDLSLGDNLVLQSRIRTITFDAQVVGIFLSKSVADEGIIGPLWIGKMLGGLQADKVNMIQIKFDTGIQTKSSLKSIILGTHSLKINIIDNKNDSLDTSLQKVELYSWNKEKINESQLDETNTASFKLPFGKYFVKFNSINFTSINYESVLLTKDQEVNLYSYSRLFNISIKFSISDHLINNSEIIIENLELSKSFSIFTNGKGFASSLIPEGYLKVTFRWKTYVNSIHILHENNSIYNINFQFLTTIEIKDTNSDLFIPNTEIKFVNLEDNNTIQTKSDSKGKLVISILPATSYNVSITNSFYGRSFIVSQFNQSKIIYYLGNSSLLIKIVDNELGIVPNQPVNVTVKNSFYNTYEVQTLISNIDGLIEINLSSGSIIHINSTYGSNNYTFSKNVVYENANIINFYLGKQKFVFKLIGLISNNDTDLNEFNLSIKNNKTNEEINEKIIADSEKIIFLEFGNYSIKLSHDDLVVNDMINFNSPIKNTYILNFNTPNFSNSTDSDNGTIGINFKSILLVNLTLHIQNELNQDIENSLVIIYDINNRIVFSGVSNINGDIFLTDFNWGFYYIEIHEKNKIEFFQIEIQNNQDNYFLFSLSSSSGGLLEEIGFNLGKWTVNRNYQLFDSDELSTMTINNLGFSLAFLSLFFIILLMTILGLMAVLHHPIYLIKDSIKTMIFLGSDSSQIKYSITLQISLIASIIGVIGNIIGLFVINFIPNFQKISIAGMIIQPITTPYYIPVIFFGFGILASIFTYKYITNEYFVGN